MRQKALFYLALLALAGLGVVGLLVYLPESMPTPHLIAGDERTIVLEVVWGGDTYTTSPEPSCDIWTAQFNCELRRGGDLGSVVSQTLPLLSPVALPDPPEAGVVVTTTLTWDTSSLAVGPYETFCRLEETNGVDEIWGYIEGEGHDGDGFYMADKFAVGEICIVARRFIATVQ